MRATANRMFVHAATSGNFDDSPSSTQVTEALGLPGGGFHYPNGTIFDRLRIAGVPFRIYADDDFPNVAELSGISVVWDINDYENFAGDVNSGSYTAAYTFIDRPTTPCRPSKAATRNIRAAASPPASSSSRKPTRPFGVRPYGTRAC